MLHMPLKKHISPNYFNIKKNSYPSVRSKMSKPPQLEKKKRQKRFLENENEEKNNIIIFSDQHWTGHTVKYKPKFGYYRIPFG